MVSVGQEFREGLSWTVLAQSLTGVCSQMVTEAGIAGAPQQQETAQAFFSLHVAWEPLHVASPQGPVWVSSMHGGLETDRLLIMAAQGSKQVSKKNHMDDVSLFMILPQKSHCVILPWSQAHLDSGRGNTDPWPRGCAACTVTQGLTLRRVPRLV